MRDTRAGLLAGTVLASLMLASSPALAQNADEDDTATGAEIVVTATKREESVQNVPISMSVVSGKQLADFQATDVKSIMNSVPNVFVQQTAGNDVVYIRGFGSPPSNFSFDQSVSMYMDGIYAGKIRQAQAPSFDVGRVEVLRGPQGALFGKNTAAGAISIVSAGPTKELEGGVTALYNFDEQGFDVTGYVSGPISDTLSARFAVRFQDQDGYIKNTFNGKDEPHSEMFMLRGTLKWEPSDRFDTTAKFEYANLERTGGYNSSGSLTVREEPRYTRYSTQNPIGPEGITNRSIIASNTANLYFGEHTLTSVTGYSWYDGAVVNNFDQLVPGTTTTVANSVYNSYPENFRQFSQELRLLSPAGRTIEYIVGAYYDNSKYQLDQLGGFDIAALNYFGLLHTTYKQKAHSGSVFGQVTVRPIERIRIIGSLRHTSTHKEGDFRGKLEYGPFAIRPVNTVAVDKFTESNTDPSITLQVDAAEGVMLYATYGRGSKSGGFVSNTYGTTNATFRYLPERSRNYEAGVKFTLLDRQRVGNISAYNTQFKNLQVSVYNPAISTYVTGNAASATSKGVEGALSFKPSRHFDITLTGAYQDIKYDDYPGASCLATQPVSVCNPAQTDPTQQNHPRFNNLAGYRPPYTSKWTGSATVHGQFDLSDSMRLDLTGVAAGRSSYNASDNQDPIFGYQPGYVKVDLRAQIGPDDQKWHLAVVAKNVTNEKTIGSAFRLPSPITSVPRAIKYLEPPRSIAVEAGFKF